MTQLSGKIALVTEGARGIGRGIAVALAAAGCDVAIADVERISSTVQRYGTVAVGGLTDAQTTVDEIPNLGRRSIALQADVSKREDTLWMVEETIGQLGDLNILVCNAGVVNISTVEAMCEDAWDHRQCKRSLPVVPSGNPCYENPRWGCVINIASVSGKNGSAELAHYCALKFAVVGFTNSLAKELSGANIRLNAICPGILRTQMWEYLADALKQEGESKELTRQRYVQTLIPLGRPKTPQDIGQLAVYLATAENVTDQAMNVDGGIELH